MENIFIGIKRYIKSINKKDRRLCEMVKDLYMNT